MDPSDNKLNPSWALKRLASSKDSVYKVMRPHIRLESVCMNVEPKGEPGSFGAERWWWFGGAVLAAAGVVVAFCMLSGAEPSGCGYGRRAAVTDPILYESSRVAHVPDPAQVAVFVTYGTSKLDCIEEGGYSLKYPERVLEFTEGKFYHTSNERMLGCFAYGKYPLLEFGDRLIKDGHFSYVAFANCACSGLSFKGNDTLLSSPVTDCLLRAVKGSNLVTGYQVEGIFLHLSTESYDAAGSGPGNGSSVAKTWEAAVAGVAKAVDTEAGASVSDLMKLTPMTTALVYLLRDRYDGLESVLDSMVNAHRNVCEGPALPLRSQSNATVASLVRDYWLRGFSDSRCPLRPAAGSRAIFSRAPPRL